MRRRSSFIWTPGQKIDRRPLSERPAPETRRHDGRNRWFLFRRTLDLPARPDEASLRITVDGRYLLYVNGAPVGRGPVRSGPLHRRLDPYDLTPLLHAGSNALAVLVRVYGLDTGWYEASRSAWQPVFGDGGLYVDGELVWGERRFALASDEGWRCLESRAWEADVPRPNPSLPPLEVHDANCLPADWTEPRFDDSDWEIARPLLLEPGALEGGFAGARIEPFPTLLEREIPRPLEQLLYPEMLLRVDGVRPRPDLPLERRIWEEERVPLRASEDPQALRQDAESPALVQTRPDMDIALLVDFGRLHPGHPFVELEAKGGEIVEVAASEGLEGEAEAESGIASRLRAPPTGGVQVFRYVARPGRQRFEAFEWSALRYLQVVVRNAVGGLALHEIGSRALGYPAERRGSFRCSDPLLERLWTLGQQTLQCCMVDAWIDTPARDQRQDLADAAVMFPIAQAAFGPSVNPLNRQVLLHGAESQGADGLTRPFAPGDPVAGSPPVLDRTLFWILNAEQHLRYSGDQATIEAVFPAIERALGWFDRQLDGCDLLADLPYRQWLDHAAVGRDGAPGLINALLVGALRAAARMAGVIERARVTERYEGLADRVASALNARHWDARRHVYVDVVDPESGRQDLRVSQHVNAALILFEIAPRERWPEMLARISDPKRLAFTAAPPIVPTGDELDPEEGVVLANTFFSHFVLRAYARAGRFDLALEALRTLWLPMLESGTTALWESFEPTGSLCYGPAATPLFQLSSEVLGVKPLSDGFGRIRIAPRLGDLTSAEGVFPTVRGDVRVAWRRERAQLRLHLELPPGTEGRLVPPQGFAAPPGSGGLRAGKHDLQLPRE